MHILAHYALYLPVPRELAIRLPSLLGYWVMVTCVLLFVARRVSLLNACVGTSVVFCQFQYAIEGRAYGLVLGLAGLSLLIWQSAIESARPVWQSIALGTCLAAATFAHFYGFLLILPFTLAELVRHRSEPKTSSAILGSCLVGILPLAAILPFARYARTWSTTFWGQPRLGSTFAAYYSLCGGPLLFALAIACLVTSGSISRVMESRARMNLKLPHYETTIMVVCLLMPVWVFLLSLYTRAYSPRYAILFLPGAAMLASWTLQKLQLFGPVAHWIGLAVVIQCVAFQVDRKLTELSRQRVAFENVLDDVNYVLSHDKTIACVLTEHHVYLSLQSYLKLEWNHRVYCLYYSSRPEAYRTIRELSRITKLNLLEANDVPSDVRRGKQFLFVRQASLPHDP